MATIKATPKFTATYNGVSGSDVNEIGAVCDAILNAGDILQINIIPAPTKTGYRMCAVVELQHGDKATQRMRAIEWESDEHADERLATPFTLVQEIAKSDNTFPKNYEENLFKAAIKKLGKKVTVSAIKDEKAAPAITAAA